MTKLLREKHILPKQPPSTTITLEVDKIIDINSHEGGIYLLKEIRAKLQSTDSLLIKRTDKHNNNANNAHNKF